MAASTSSRLSVLHVIDGVGVGGGAEESLVAMLPLLRDRGIDSTVVCLFARDGWEPVVLEVRDDFPRSVAAYTQYDALFVNAVFDGLNLVAKEAPLVNQRDGVVVLSRNAGAYEELEPWVVAVDPFDIAGQAEALHEALSLPDGERHWRAESIRSHVREHDLTEWLDLQLADLDRVSALRV